MSLKETYKNLRDLLSNITIDLEKADNGNKAASQRVRTGTVRLEKVAKIYRKESIASEKKTKGQKRPSKTTKGGKTSRAKSPAKATVKAKAKAKATSFRPRQLSVKRASAKLPTGKYNSAR